MTRTTRTRKPGKPAVKSGHGSAGPISFFIALFIVALGAIQLVSTFYTYALTLSDLNGLKRQEAALEAEKQDLENQIKRWDDEAYVTAQARERLGFVFPGEQAVRVLHPEAVTGQTGSEQQGDGGESDGQSLPWYEELAYAFEQVDNQDAPSDAAAPSKEQEPSSQPGAADTSGEE